MWDHMCQVESGQLRARGHLWHLEALDSRKARCWRSHWLRDHWRASYIARLFWYRWFYFLESFFKVLLTNLQFTFFTSTLLSCHFLLQGTDRSLPYQSREICTRVTITAKVTSNCFQVYICVQWGFCTILSERETSTLVETLKTSISPHNRF